MARDFVSQLRGYREEDREFDIRRALTLCQAQGELENAIANAYVHFPLPGGFRARYHDTLCYESIHWTHVVHFIQGDAESERKATSQVTCPVCLENLTGLGMI